MYKKRLPHAPQEQQLMAHFSLSIISYKRSDWSLASGMFSPGVGCSRVQQRLERLDDNAHVWPEVSFVLDAQCRDSCKLFQTTHRRRNGVTSGFTEEYPDFSYDRWNQACSENDVNHSSGSYFMSIKAAVEIVLLYVTTNTVSGNEILS